MFSQIKHFLAFQTLTRRVNRHVHARESVLIRAVWHVWIAKFSGLLLAKVKNKRLQSDAIAVWRSKVAAARNREGF